MSKSLLELKIFVSRSKLRINVLQELGKEEQIAVFLANKLKKHRESISFVFRDFKNEGLVECINPQDHNFKRYKLTELGKKVLNEL